MKETSINKAKGFTLLEMMIVVSISAILGVIAIPELAYTLKSNKIRASASEMHLSLLYARSEAIKRNSTVTVTPVSSGWQVKSGTTVLKEFDQLPGTIAISCDGTCPATVSYSKTGRATPSATEFRFHMTGEEVSPRCVQINLNGKPSVFTDNDHNYANGCQT